MWIFWDAHDLYQKWPERKYNPQFHIQHTTQAWRSVVTFAYWQTLQAPPVHRRLAFKTCAFWTHFLSENPVTLFICEFVIFNLQYLTLLRNIYICLLFLILNPVCPKSGPPLIGRPPLFLHHPSLQLVLIPRENSRMSFLDHTFYIWDIHFKNISSIIKCEDSKGERPIQFYRFYPPKSAIPCLGKFCPQGVVPSSSATFFCFTK